MGAANWGCLAVFSVAVIAGALFGTGNRLLFQWPVHMLFALSALFGLLLAGRSQSFGKMGNIWATLSFLALIGYVIWRAIRSEAPYLGRHDALLAASALSVYCIIVNCAQNNRWKTAVVVCLLVSGLVHVGFAVYQWKVDDTFVLWSALTDHLYARSGGLGYQGRVSGCFNAPTHLAAFLTSLLAVCGGLFVVGGWWRAIGIVCGLLFALVLPLTFSRIGVAGAIGTAAVWACYVVVLVAYASKVRAAVFLLLVLVTTAGVGSILWAQHGARFAARQAESSKGGKGFLGNSARPAMWSVAIQQAESSPVLGTGSRSFKYHFRQSRPKEFPVWLRGEPVFAHNEYLQYLAEYGWIGMGLLVSVVGAHLLNGFRFVLRCRRRIGKDRFSPDERRRAKTCLSRSSFHNVVHI